MELSITNLALDGVRLIRPVCYGDSRGYFLETHHVNKYANLGLTETFVQDNLSRSVRGTLRGLHFQLRHPQAKLLQVVRGAVWDVAVDIRWGSPTFGQWVAEELSEENHTQIYVPQGFAHGFCVISDTADVWYKCSDYYDPADDRGILWSDPDLGIPWPAASPLISGKDGRLPRLHDVPRDQLPPYGVS